MKADKKRGLRANNFKAARKQHGTESAEDYTELIHDLIESQGEARTCNIAAHLGISHVTALRTIRRLQEQGYVTTSPHKPVELTTKGKEIAAYSKKRHDLLVNFFLKIGVSKKQAEIDTEGAEHHISRESLRKIAELMEKI